MTSYLAYNGGTGRILIVPAATDEDNARAQAAGRTSDGAELTLIPVPTSGSPVDVTALCRGWGTKGNKYGNYILGSPR